MKLKKAKALLVAPNIATLHGEEGPLCPIDGVLAAAREKEVPVVFALSRQSMGKVRARHSSP